MLRKMDYISNDKVYRSIQFHWGTQDWRPWGVCFCFKANTPGGVDHAHVHVGEAIVVLHAGDWIIKDSDGTFRVSKDQPDDPDMEVLSNALLNTPIRFGLVAQGHIPAIITGIRDGKSFAEIAELIGWEETAFRRHLAWLIEG